MFSAAFTTSCNYTDHSLISIPRHPAPPSSRSIFFSIHPPLPASPIIILHPPSSLSICSFFSSHRELSCRMPDRGGKPDVKFANGLNSNYPGVSFARSLRSAFFFFFAPLAFAFLVMRWRIKLCKNVAKNVPDPRKERKCGGPGVQ